MVNANRTGGTVSFILRISTKNKKPISLCYSYGRRKRLVYAIGYSVEEKYWDKKKNRVKNVVAIRNSNEINDLMRDLESELLNFVAKSDAEQKIIDNDLLREHLNSFTNKNQKVVEEEFEKITDFLTYIPKFIQRKERELPKGRNGSKNQTVKSYEQAYMHLLDYSKFSGYSSVFFDEVDIEFLSGFTEYMNNKVQPNGILGYAFNTIGKHIKTIHTFMNGALEEELHTNLKYRKYKPKFEDTVAIYLTLEELRSMYKLDLRTKPHLSLARDIFLIGCEIGQRISDYYNLENQTTVKYDNESYIEILQQKVKKKVMCKITPVVQKIMEERYDGNLPDRMSEQKINQYIKDIGKLAEINESVRLEYTRGGVRQLEYKPKYNLIMGHTARRTFCTLKYKAGMPIHDIMQLSGHSTEKEFMKYIRNPKEERIAQITNSEAFKNSSIL